MGDAGLEFAAQRPLSWGRKSNSPTQRLGAASLRPSSKAPSRLASIAGSFKFLTTGIRPSRPPLGGRRPIRFIREGSRPFRREQLHVDFFAPNLLMPVRAIVPIAFHNPSNTIDGMLAEIRNEVEVEALPASIPHQIDIDVSELVRPGDSIRVGDLNLPQGVTAVTAEAETIVQIEAATRSRERQLKRLGAAAA